MKNTPPQTWGGRFAAGPAASVRPFTENVSFDQRLYRQDIAGSIARAQGLAKVGLLTKGDAAKIVPRHKAIQRKIEAGKFTWDAALGFLTPQQIKRKPPQRRQILRRVIRPRPTFASCSWTVASCQENEVR